MSQNSTSHKGSTEENGNHSLVKKKHHKQHNDIESNGDEEISWRPKEHLKVFGIVEGFGRHRDVIDIYDCPPKCCHSKGNVSTPKFISRIFKLIIWLGALALLLYYLIIRGPELTNSQISTFEVENLHEVETPNILLCQPNPFSEFSLTKCGLYANLISTAAPPIQNCTSLGQNIKMTQDNYTYDCILFQGLQIVKNRANVFLITGIVQVNNSLLYGVAVGLFHPFTTPQPAGLVIAPNGFVNYITYQRDIVQEGPNITYSYLTALSSIPGEFTWLQNSSGNSVNGYDSELVYLFFSPVFKETMLTIKRKDFFDYLEQFGGAVATIEFWLALMLFFHFGFEQYYFFCLKYKKKRRKRDFQMSSEDC